MKNDSATVQVEIEVDGPKAQAKLVIYPEQHHHENDKKLRVKLLVH